MGVKWELFITPSPPHLHLPAPEHLLVEEILVAAVPNVIVI